MKDFFISYTKTDKDWATWIAWKLEKAGYTTLIQAWDFGPGTNFVIEMQKAHQHTSKTIVVLSQDYLSSSFATAEWAARFAEDPEAKERKLVPIRVRECNPEGLLGPVVYVDLVGISEHDAEAKLLEAFKEGRPKPLVQPPYPGRVPVKFPGPDEGGSPSRGPTVVQGAKSIRITISQVFRLVDLVTSPKQLREDAREFADFSHRYRRSLSSRKTFDIKGLGSLKPVGGEADEYSGFWRTALPALRDVASPSILFLPLELSLTDQLNKLQPSLSSVLEQSLGKNEDLVENKQVSGRLRIYPPGVGVSRIAITLTFKTDVDIETVGQVARQIEQLAFVDPAGGSEQACEALLQDTIEKVVRFLFGEEYLIPDRRWRPPEIVYSILRYEGQSLEQNVPALAYLLSFTPGNQEMESSMEARLRTALRSKHWTADGILALASQRASLLVIGASYAAGRIKKQKQLREWLTEASELVWAECYVAKVFAEEIGKFAALGLLDDEWLPGSGEKFNELESMLQSSRSVLRAIEVTQTNIRDLGEGMVTILATTLWWANNEVNQDVLLAGLSYIAEWLRSSDDRQMKSLLRCVEDVKKLSDLFKPQT